MSKKSVLFKFAKLGAQLLTDSDDMELDDNSDDFDDDDDTVDDDDSSDDDEDSSDDDEDSSDDDDDSSDDDDDSSDDDDDSSDDDEDSPNDDEDSSDDDEDSSDDDEDSSDDDDDSSNDDDSSDDDSNNEEANDDDDDTVDDEDSSNDDSNNEEANDDDEDSNDSASDNPNQSVENDNELTGQRRDVHVWYHHSYRSGIVIGIVGLVIIAVLIYVFIKPSEFIPDSNWREKVSDSDTERCANDIISATFNYKSLNESPNNSLKETLAISYVTNAKLALKTILDTKKDADLAFIATVFVKAAQDSEEVIYNQSKGKYRCNVENIAKYQIKEYNGNDKSLPNVFKQFVNQYAKSEFEQLDTNDIELLSSLSYIFMLNTAYNNFIEKAGYDLNAPAIANSNNNAQNPSSKGADVNTNVNDSTPLHDAAEQGDVNKVKALIDKGANVDAKDKNGNTPLHLASLKGRPEVIKLLISSNADVNARTVLGKSPLHLALTLLQSAEAVKLLISSGANVNAKDNDGTTPLHEAAAGVGLMALEIASDATEKDKRELTERYANAMEMLIAAGSDINAKDNDGTTPLNVAVAHNRGALANVLRAHMAAPTPTATPNHNASDTEKRCDTQTISNEKHLPKWNIEIIDSSVITSMLKDAEKTHLPFLKINASDNLKQKLEDYINKNPSRLHENSQNTFTCEPGKYIRTASNIGIQLVSCNDDEISIVFLNLVSPVDNKARVYTAKTFDHLFEKTPVIDKTEETVINGERGAYVAVKYETESDGTGTEYTETDVVYYIFLGDKLRFLTDWNAFHIEESWHYDDDGTTDYSCDNKATVLRLENSEAKHLVR